MEVKVRVEKLTSSQISAWDITMLNVQGFNPISLRHKNVAMNSQLVHQTLGQLATTQLARYCT